MFRPDLSEQALDRHQTRALRMIETHWENCREGAGLPCRASIDPRKIEDGLEYAFLIERIAAGHARIRVAGGHLNALAGMEVAGIPLSLFLQPRARDDFGQALCHLFDDPAKLSFELQSGGRFGIDKMRGHMILFPLLDDFGQVTRAICGLTTTGRIMRAPRRFDISSLKIRPVSGNTTPFTPPMRKTPNLRLVVDNG